MQPKASRYRKSIIFAAKSFMYLGAGGIFWLSYLGYFDQNLLGTRGSLIIMASYLALLFLFGRIYGAFKIGTTRRGELIYSAGLALLLANASLYVQLSLIYRGWLTPWWMAASAAVQIMFVAVLTILVNRLYYFLFPMRNIVAICKNIDEKKDFFRRISYLHEKYDIQKTICCDIGLKALLEAMASYQAVMVCDLPRETLEPLLVYCYVHEKRVYMMPDVPDLLINQGSSSLIFDTPVLLFKNKTMDIEQAIIKRAMDILISIVMLCALSPFLFLAAVLIKLEDGGPVFFRQERVTKNGRSFVLVKFRSMIVDAEIAGPQKSIGNKDPRVTRVGRVIRPMRFDEIPQLFNVLGGSMSLVGPRPERVENVEEYSAKLPEFTLRLKVKAGITGYAQVYGKYNTSPRDKLNMDLLYIERYSIWQDLLLLAMTPKILFMRQSTEGFDTPND